MSLLSVNKIYQVIETAELVYGVRVSGRINKTVTFIDKLSNYLEDLKTTGRCSVKRLHQYIDGFSQEEKAEVIALMWLGRSVLDGQAEDFPHFVKLVIDLIPQNYATSYIVEKPLLAKYLRGGLQKLNICTSASS